MSHPVRMTRRNFVTTAATLPVAMKALAMKSAPAPTHLLVGTQDGEGIYRHTWNAATGEIGPEELAAKTSRPNYFALHPTLPVLYSTNEREGNQAVVAAFRFDAATAALTLLDQQSSHGDDPCFVSIDHGGTMVFVANYSGGSMACLPVQKDGALGEAVTTYDYSEEKPSPNKERQDKSHLHSATLSPNGRFVLACDLGCDKIRIFRIGRAASAKHGFVEAGSLPTVAGSGPRHVAFHPNGKWMYCIHELSCTVDLFDISETASAVTATPRADSAVSTLTPGHSLQGQTACELLISDDGRFAHICTRGVDELVMYAIDPATGALSEIQRLSCGGANPRLIAFDPSRQWLLCANQNSTFVTVFAHDSRTGRLSEPPRKFAASSPMCFAFI